MEDQLLGGRKRSLGKEVIINDKGVPVQKVRARSGSSGDSTNPISHDSCHGSPPIESSTIKEIFIPSNNEQCVALKGSPESRVQPTNGFNSASAYRMPDNVIAELEEPFGGMLIEDAGSSKDLRNLCPSVAEAILEDMAPEPCGTNLPGSSYLAPKQCMDTINTSTTPFAARKEMKTVTIKATYREDIIRFRVTLTCGIVELKEEIAKRLKLEVGTFDVKYLDDDHEWVLIACDADLQECIDVTRSSGGSNIIRVLVHDITSNLGSAYESSGE